MGRKECQDFFFFINLIHSEKAFAVGILQV